MARHDGARSTSLATVAIAAVAVLLLLAALGAYLYLQRSSPSASPAPGAPGLPAGGAPSIDAGSLWEVAFTQPLIPDTDRALHRGGLDEKLVALMQRATKTLDVAIYDFDLQNVAEAMAQAVPRGVRVRMVTDTDTIENTKDERIQVALRTVRAAGIQVVADNRQPIMHNKFTVVDGEWVQTGSWNYTDGDTYRLNNNLAIFRSRELAETYTAEFEKMFTQRRFGPSKPKGAPRPSLSLGGLRIESYFSPEDGIAARLVERVNAAQRKIHFLAFSFTLDSLGQAMAARKQAGVEVQGVFEGNGADTQFSEMSRLKQAGAEVYTDGSPYFMHHKVILLDDRITIFGSYNFSSNADRDNDENLLIVDDPQFTALYEQEFQRMLALAKNPPPRR